MVMALDEERILFERYRQALAAQDAATARHVADLLVVRNLPLVKYIATIFAMHTAWSVELEELIAAGNLGLVQAFQTFNPDWGNRFGSYAAIAIRRRMCDVLSRIRHKSVEAVSLDVPLEGASELTLADTLASTAGLSHARVFELREVLALGLHALTKREREVILLRFGLDDNNELGAEQPRLVVARTLGLTTQRVWQLERAAARKFRRLVESLPHDDIVDTRRMP